VENIGFQGIKVVREREIWRSIFM